MARADILMQLATNHMKASKFDYEALQPPFPIEYILNSYDIKLLKDIAMDIELMSKPKIRRQSMKEILYPRGFKEFGAGTNRICYRFLDDYSIVIKTASGIVAFQDNINEFHHQNILKPFTCKCFETTNCGTVGLFERVDPVTTFEQFVSIWEDIFDLISTHIDGYFIMEDIGTNYFLNYGIRHGFGPVFLDYSYLYELDGNKLRCNKPDPKSPIGICDGELDYDDGFNHIICTKCGKRYLAKDLEKDIKNERIKLIKEKGDANMRIQLVRGEEIIQDINLESGQKVRSFPTGMPKVDITKIVTETVIPEETKVEENEPKDEMKVTPELCESLKNTMTGDSFNNNSSINDSPKVDKLFSSELNGEDEEIMFTAYGEIPELSESDNSSELLDEF